MREFLYSSLTNYIFNQEFKNVVSGSAQPQLPVKDLKQFHCLIPSKAEQQLLLSKAQSIESFLLAEEENLIKLHKIKRGLMHDLLTGRVRVKVSEAVKELV